MESAVAGERDIALGQQHRELVFEERIRAAEIIATLKQMPAVGLLDER